MAPVIQRRVARTCAGTHRATNSPYTRRCRQCSQGAYVAGCLARLAGCAVPGHGQPRRGTTIRQAMTGTSAGLYASPSASAPLRALNPTPDHLTGPAAYQGRFASLRDGHSPTLDTPLTLHRMALCREEGGESEPKPTWSATTGNVETLLKHPTAQPDTPFPLAITAGQTPVHSFAIHRN